MVFSPDGTRLAVVSDLDEDPDRPWPTLTLRDLFGTTSWLEVFDTRTPWRLWRLGDPGHDCPVAFSPDGRVLALAGYRGVELYSTASGEMFQRLGMPEGVSSASDLFYLPDGESIIVVTGGVRPLVTFSLASGKAQAVGIERELTSLWEYRGRVALSPDGSLLAGCGKGAVHLWNTRTWERKATLNVAADRPVWIEFSPDGKLLFCRGSNTTRGKPHDEGELLDLATGKRIHGWRYPPAHVAFAGTGNVVMCFEFGFDGLTARDTLTGTALGNLATHHRQSDDLIFSRDGRILAVGARIGSRKYSTIELWDGQALLAAVARPAAAPAAGPATVPAAQPGG
jgi:WD40 repeat protein